MKDKENKQPLQSASSSRPAVKAGKPARPIRPPLPAAHPPPAKKLKVATYEDIPANPLGYSTLDEEGKPVKFGTAKFVKQYGLEHRLNAKTKAKYQREWAKLEKFVIDRYGEDQWRALLSSQLLPETLSAYVATYLMSRINLKEWRERKVM